MGGALSISQTTTTQQHAKLQQNEQEVVKLMMPVYYLDDEVSLGLSRLLLGNSFSTRDPLSSLCVVGPRISIITLQLLSFTMCFIYASLMSIPYVAPCSRME